MQLLKVKNKKKTYAFSEIHPLKQYENCKRSLKLYGKQNKESQDLFIGKPQGIITCVKIAILKNPLK